MNPATFIAAVLIAVQAAHPQWQTDVRLTFNVATSFTPFNYKAVAASGNLVHLVWYDNRDGNFEIYYKRSTDHGLTWGPDTRLTINSGISWFSSIAVSGSDVHIIWMDDRDGNFEIYYKRSADGGLTWSIDTRLTTNAATSRFPSVAASGSVINVIWQDTRDGNPEIYNKRSADGGLTWGTDVRLTFDPADSIFASVASSGQTVNVMWEEYRDGNAEIYNKRSSDVGLSWSVDTRLTNDAAISFSPSVWVSGLDVHVAWYDGRDGNSEIYYKRSLDGGATWELDTRMTNQVNGSFHVSVAAVGPNVHLAWYDERDGGLEVYYKHSIDTGATWGSDMRLTFNPGNSESSHPSIAIAGQNVNLVWQDNRDGNLEIYYKRNPLGNPTAADINSDGNVNVTDLLSVINAWGTCPHPPQICPADLFPSPDGDGAVNVGDLLFVIDNWG